MDIRLRKTGEYIMDIENLRNLIRRNGTKACLERITVSHPYTGQTVDMYLNLAFESKNNAERINGSLYTVAFGNGNGVWHFDVGNIGIELPGKPFIKKNNLSGNYDSLHHSTKLPTISNQKLFDAIQAVSRYAGKKGELIDVVFEGMAILLVAINEAIRFKEIEIRVNNLLNNVDEYQPSFNLVHNWGGHVIGV